jgi:osmotically inducible lipoprotein OsmB
MSTISMRKSGAIAALFATAVAISACGSTPADRAVSGGVLGAGGGAAIGSLYGDAGRGAVIGAVGGATVGALTAPPPPPPRGYYDRDGYDDRYYQGYYDGYYARDRYYDQPRCVRWSRYSNRCLEWR